MLLIKLSYNLLGANNKASLTQKLRTIEKYNIKKTKVLNFGIIKVV